MIVLKGENLVIWFSFKVLFFWSFQQVLIVLKEF